VTKVVYRWDVADVELAVPIVLPLPTLAEIIPIAEFTVGRLTFWTVCDPNAPHLERTFEIYGTGHPIPDGRVWRATAPRYGGLVFHLFEVLSQ
jgi:hypothetical protein